MGFKSVPILVGFTDSNVNTKQTGATSIFTNPNSNGIYFPYKVRVYGANLSGIVTPPTFTIGTNASSYNNILSTTAIVGLTSNTFIDYPVNFPASLINFGDNVFVNITIGAVGTTYGCKFALFMDYFG